jgi:cell division septal protein FtsQ
MTYTDERKEWIRSRRNRRKHARRARLNRQVFRYILLLTIFSAGCYSMTRLNWKISNPDADVIVRGNNVVSAEQVRTALGDIGWQKIFQLDPHKLEKKIETLKAVKYAFVRRYSIPKPTVVVEVLEEFPWATFSTSPDLPPQAVISQSGRLIPLKEFPTITQPALVIYGPPGLKLTSKSVAQWASSIAFIGSQTGQPVQAVDMRRSYEIGVQDGDLFLKLGGADATLNRRLGRLSSILSAIEPLKSRLEYVDLSLDNNIPLKVAKKPIENRQQFDGASAIERSMQAELPLRGNI